MHKTLCYLSLVFLSACFQKQSGVPGTSTTQDNESTYKNKYDSLLSVHVSGKSESPQSIESVHEVDADGSLNAEEQSLLLTGGGNVKGFKLLLPGNLDYYYDGPEMKAGDKFWGVFHYETQDNLQLFTLREVTVKSFNKQLPSPIVFDSSDLGAVFYFAGFTPGNKMVAGKTTTNKFFSPGALEHIQLKNSEYIIYADGDYARKGASEPTSVFGAIKDYELRLRHLSGGVVLGEYPLVARTNYEYTDDIRINDEVETFVIWAGDLNDDGRLDILAGNGMKSCSTVTLYLSGRSTQKVVSPVASTELCSC